jgi:hypothetical protein
MDCQQDRVLLASGQAATLQPGAMENPVAKLSW